MEFRDCDIDRDIVLILVFGGRPVASIRASASTPLSAASQREDHGQKGHTALGKTDKKPKQDMKPGQGLCLPCRPHRLLPTLLNPWALSSCQPLQQLARALQLMWGSFIKKRAFSPTRECGCGTGNDCRHGCRSSVLHANHAQEAVSKGVSRRGGFSACAFDETGSLAAVACSKPRPRISSVERMEKISQRKGEDVRLSTLNPKLSQDHN
eukprot:g47071.t1